MRCVLCIFLILKSQTALYHTVWCGAVYYYLQCSAIMPFCGRFWYDFCDLRDLCNLVNTHTHTHTHTHLLSQTIICEKKKIVIHVKVTNNLSQSTTK